MKTFFTHLHTGIGFMLFATVFFISQSAPAQIFNQVVKVVGSGTNGRVKGDNFGNSVAISGDYAIVGVPNQAFNAAGADSMRYAGAAYIFYRSNGIWNFQQKLVGSTNSRMAGENFGNSVAISGDYAIVGASHQYFSNGTGAAYVFNRSGTTWSQQQKLMAADQQNGDYFGYSVAISGDYAIVGVPNQAFNAAGTDSVLEAGAAYVFNRSGTTWSQQQKLVGTGTNSRKAQDMFGYSVSISGDYAIVGAYGQAYDAAGASAKTGAGAAYVFNRSGNTWNQQQKLVPNGIVGGSNSRDNFFGSSVSISGDYILVGAPYQSRIGTPGGPLINQANFAGAAYIFNRNGSSWGQTQPNLTPTGRVALDYFGNSVAISGNYALIGAYRQDYDTAGNNYVDDAGAAYVFEVSTSQSVPSFQASSRSIVTLAPQPIREGFTLINNNASLESTVAKVLDMQGREIARFRVQNNVSVDASGWPVGIYLLHLSDGSALRVVKE